MFLIPFMIFTAAILSIITALKLSMRINCYSISQLQSFSLLYTFLIARVYSLPIDEKYILLILIVLYLICIFLFFLSFLTTKSTFIVLVDLTDEYRELIRNIFKKYDSEETSELIFTQNGFKTKFCKCPIYKKILYLIDVNISIYSREKNTKIVNIFIIIYCICMYIAFIISILDIYKYAATILVVIMALFEGHIVDLLNRISNKLK